MSKVRSCTSSSVSMVALRLWKSKSRRNSPDPLRMPSLAAGTVSMSWKPKRAGQSLGPTFSQSFCQAENCQLAKCIRFTLQDINLKKYLYLRTMITKAWAWAKQQKKWRVNTVHGEEEIRIVLSETFQGKEVEEEEMTREGNMEVQVRI